MADLLITNEGPLLVLDGLFEDLTSGYLPYWTGTALDDSPLITDGTKVVLGTSSLTGTHVTGLLSIVSSAGEFIYLSRFSDNASGVNIKTWKARGTEISPTVLSANDFLAYWENWGYVRNSGNTANAYVKLTDIFFKVESLDAQGRGAGAIEFYTCPGVSATPTIKLTVGATQITSVVDVIVSSGKVGIGTSSPVCPLEVEDNNTTAPMVVKITQDDATVYGLMIGNDTYSTDDTLGLYLNLNNTGTAAIVNTAIGNFYIVASGTVDSSSIILSAENLISLQDWNAGVPTSKFVFNLVTGDFYSIGGSFVLPASEYVNFGGTQGSTSYGIRDNAGQVEVKDAGGTWRSLKPIPIGGIYLSTTGVNPATELGYGTWNQVAQGQFLVGAA